MGQQANSLYVDGFVNSRQKLMLLDTGATKTIVRPVVLQNSADVRPTRWRLRSATGEPASIHERYDVVVEACLIDGADRGSEPRPDDELIGRGVAIGKCLVRANDAVPVRLLNANGFPVHLKKGTPLGRCSPVSSVVRSVNASDQRNERLHEKLTELVADSSKGLNREPQKRLRVFITEEADRIIKEMEEEGVIEQSASPWSSPVVLVKKKDGSTRLCVDYRQLNNVTKKDSYPLPRIDDTLDTLAGSKVFSTLDLKSGYWQVEMDPGDKENTAFTVGSGLWQFTVMPFGLCNAPATFERLMETVLKGLSWETCLVYLDDIIVVGKSFDDHFKNLEQIQDGREVVIGYFSKRLSKPERNYCVSRRELLAIVKSVEHFYKYLYGRKFLLRTDHASLTWLLRFKNPEGQVARWIERLQEFDFDIEHRAGKSHGNADVLSRRPCPDDCAHCNRAETKDAITRRTTIVDEHWRPTELQKDQEEDPSLKLIIEFGCKPGDDVAGEDYVANLHRRRDEAHEKVRHNIRTASDRMKMTYDVGSSEIARPTVENPESCTWLAPFAGDNAEAQVRELQQLHPELSFGDFMATHTGTAKDRFGVTREEHPDLFTVPDEYALAHCVARDLRMSRGIASEFQRLFGQLDELKRQGGRVGQVLELRSDQRRLYYLISKEKSYQKPTYRTVWEALLDLREELLTANVLKLAIPRLACGRDGLDWRIIRNMLEFSSGGGATDRLYDDPRNNTDHFRWMTELKYDLLSCYESSSQRRRRYMSRAHGRWCQMHSEHSTRVCGTMYLTFGG
ncbi:unnamed protein product, partial [Callosobruchus maculatus]